MPVLQHTRVMSLGIDGKIPFDQQVFRPAKRHIGQIAKGLLLQFQVRQALRQLLQKHLQLHARQVFAHALVCAVTKRQMVCGVVTVNIQQVCVREMLFIMVGRSHQHQKFCARR